MENCCVRNASVATGLEKKKRKMLFAKESGRCLMQNSQLFFICS